MGEEQLLAKYESVLNLSPLALDILNLRYLKRNNDGDICESPIQMYYRVAKNIAAIDKEYERTNFENKALATTELFFKHLVEQNFVPASPILMNAGNSLQSLFSDHALDVPDNMQDIFEVLKLAATIQQHGGGVGFSFSKVRPHHDEVRGMKDVAFGPINVMNIFDTSFEAIVQGGRRAGANMAVLDISHPDIEAFISVKKDSSKMKNFNLSVALSDEFMQTVVDNDEFSLTNPRTGKITKTVRARNLFENIATQAWSSGDPGIIFIDEMDASYPFKEDKVLCTGACGQYQLENFEGVPYAHINLVKMLLHTEDSYELDEEKLRETVHVAVHFLDNCIDAHQYTHKKVEEATKASRKIGLGVMGFADMLYYLNISYGSPESLELISHIMSMIKEESRKASHALALSRGEFPRFKETKWTKKLRNATLTSIAPTGSTSILANCSPSIEPVYALSYTNTISTGEELTIQNKAFQESVKSLVIERQRKKELEQINSIQDIPWLSKNLKETFKTALDISPQDHLKVMAAFQEYVDNAISKTINIAEDTTVQEVMDSIVLAWKLKSKGITFYRDNSRTDQALQTMSGVEEEKNEE